MKLKIQIKLFDNAQLPKIIKKGDWIDLCCNETVNIACPQAQTQKRKTKNGEVIYRYRNVTFNNVMFPLGVAMKLPKGFEAHVVPRSSTFNKYGIILSNSMGIIDNTYSGNDDQWRFNAIALRDTTINKGDRICQFRIELSQHATLWQKLKWLFCSGVELIEVPSLDNENRGGFGTTN